MLLWNGLLVLLILLARFPWNMARPQLHLLSLTVKNSNVKRRISHCDPQNLQYKTHPEFWPSHRRIFKTSLYYKTRLILETRRYHDTLVDKMMPKFFWNKVSLKNSHLCSTQLQNRNLYWIFLDEVGSDQSGDILSPFMGTACLSYSFPGMVTTKFTLNVPLPVREDLTHWGRDKMDAILQTTFWSTFSWMKMFEFRLKFHWSLFLRVQLTIFQHWFR